MRSTSAGSIALIALLVSPAFATPVPISISKTSGSSSSSGGGIGSTIAGGIAGGAASGIVGNLLNQIEGLFRRDEYVCFQNVHTAFFVLITLLASTLNMPNATLPVLFRTLLLFHWMTSKL